jgi:hypothetical protein
MDPVEAWKDLLADLSEDERQWKIARVRVVIRAQHLIDTGVVSVATVAKMLHISPATWYRRRAELAALLDDDAAELAALTAATAAEDQVDARTRDGVL